MRIPKKCSVTLALRYSFRVGTAMRSKVLISVPTLNTVICWSDEVLKRRIYNKPQNTILLMFKIALLPLFHDLLWKSTAVLNCHFDPEKIKDNAKFHFQSPYVIIVIIDCILRIDVKLSQVLIAFMYFFLTID